MTLQRFLLWKEADIQKCRGKDIMICPADKPIYGRNVLNCESSLYFQRDKARTLHSRRILLQNFAPIFIRHFHDWICDSHQPSSVNGSRPMTAWCNITGDLDDVMYVHSGYIYIFNSGSCHPFNWKTKMVDSGWPDQSNYPSDVATWWFNCGSTGTKTSVIKVLKLTGD